MTVLQFPNKEAIGSLSSVEGGVVVPALGEVASPPGALWDLTLFLGMGHRISSSEVVTCLCNLPPNAIRKLEVNIPLSKQNFERITDATHVGITGVAFNHRLGRSFRVGLIAKHNGLKSLEIRQPGLPSDQFRQLCTEFGSLEYLALDVGNAPGLDLTPVAGLGNLKQFDFMSRGSMAKPMPITELPPSLVELYICCPFGGPIPDCFFTHGLEVLAITNIAYDSSAVWMTQHSQIQLRSLIVERCEIRAKDAVVSYRIQPANLSH